MAKVYNSRNLIDPNMYTVMNQQIQNRVANEANRNKEFLSSVRNMLSSVGETADDYIGRFQREKQLQNAEANKNSVSYIEDPMYRAAREEYIRTGSSQPITSYMLQREAAAARKEAEKKNAAEKEWSQNWHDSLEESAARKEFNDLTERALTAQKNGNLVQANNLVKQANRLRENWSTRGIDIGDDTQSILKAAAQEEEDKKIAEKQEAYENELDAKKAKEIIDESFEMRNFIMDNFMPVGAVKDKNEQIYLANLVRNTKMTDEDKKYLLDRIYGETKQEQVSKAQDATRASKAGEKVGKAIDEKDEKKKLADAGRAAIKAGRTPTRAQKRALDEGY